MDAAAFCTRPAAARAAFGHEADYIRTIGLERDEAFAFWDYGPELSRPFRALDVWLLIKTVGAARLSAAIEQNIACARHLERLVQASEDFEMLAPVELSVFCFRYKAGSDADNERILLAVQRGGNSYLSNAKVNGRFALRGCVLNYRTTFRDMEFMLEDVRNAARSPSGGDSQNAGQNLCGAGVRRSFETGLLSTHRDLDGLFQGQRKVTTFRSPARRATRSNPPVRGRAAGLHALDIKLYDFFTRQLSRVGDLYRNVEWLARRALSVGAPAYDSRISCSSGHSRTGTAGRPGSSGRCGPSCRSPRMGKLIGRCVKGHRQAACRVVVAEQHVGDRGPAGLAGIPGVHDCGHVIRAPN